MEQQFTNLERLRANTISTVDRDKILDAMLRVPITAKSVKAPHLQSTQQQERYDVFIAHASEDKGFVTPLALALIRKGLKVWYDDFVLKLGDSLRREIDKGLAKSRYGVVILSNSFFNKHWPLKELDGLAAKESLGVKVILPVWHGIDREDVVCYSLTLADIKAVKSSMGLETVTSEVIKAISG